jgi:hypothetical protein
MVPATMLPLRRNSAEGATHYTRLLIDRTIMTKRTVRFGEWLVSTVFERPTAYKGLIRRHTLRPTLFFLYTTSYASCVLDEVLCRPIETATLERTLRNRVLTASVRPIAAVAVKCNTRQAPLMGTQFPLRVVTGAPGSGKSTVVEAWNSADRDFRPSLVRKGKADVRCARTSGVREQW